MAALHHARRLNRNPPSKRATPPSTQGGMRLLLALALAVSTSACLAHGPRIRVATATPADFERAKDANQIWYEFQPGDTVPFHLLFFGALEGAPDKALLLTARRQFFLVSSKSMPLQISFDGQSFAFGHPLTSIFSVVPQETNTPGGQVAWMTYLGDSREPEKELQKLLDRPQPQPPTASR